jgi:hypothetical protein
VWLELRLVAEAPPPLLSVFSSRYIIGDDASDIPCMRLTLLLLFLLVCLLCPIALCGAVRRLRGVFLPISSVSQV